MIWIAFLQNPLKAYEHLPHLNGALAKPAADERLIFIDVNVPAVFKGE